MLEESAPRQPGGHEGRAPSFICIQVGIMKRHKFTLMNQTAGTGLAKKFFWVFLYHLMKKKIQTFWPTQYLRYCTWKNLFQKFYNWTHKSSYWYNLDRFGEYLLLQRKLSRMILLNKLMASKQGYLLKLAKLFLLFVQLTSYFWSHISRWFCQHNRLLFLCSVHVS